MISGRARTCEQISVRAEDAVLAAEVWRPENELQAGIVMIGGSGPTDRSNGEYFLAYRDQFTSHGIAVLWYDKRGVGESSGNWAEGTLDDLANDAIAATSALRRVQGDATPVGLFGHSEGGWVALRAAAKSGQADFVITNSCPGTTPGQADRHAVTRAISGETWPEQDKAAALRLYNDLAEAAAHDRDYAYVQYLFSSAAQYGILRPYIEPLDEALWTFFKRMHDHDPIPDCRKLPCPHLAIFGALDPLVPVAESIAAFTAAACGTGRHPVATTTIHVVPGADHRLLIQGDTGLSTSHLTCLCAWILSIRPLRTR